MYKRQVGDIFGEGHGQLAVHSGIGHNGGAPGHVFHTLKQIDVYKRQEQHPVILESMEFPEPVIDIAIEPKTKAGQDKMGEALVKLAEEDPTFRVHTDKETGQTIISGMGELHLEIIVDRLLREFKMCIRDRYNNGACMGYAPFLCAESS